MSTRTIYGNVNGNGTKHSGSEEFTVTRLDHGYYQIDFRPEYGTRPTIVASQNYRDWDDFGFRGGSTVDNLVVVAVNEKNALVKTGNENGSNTDRNFGFIAIG